MSRFFVTPDLDISLFNYPLPPELIAQQPAAERTGSRLLHLDSQGGLHDRQFTDFPALLRPGDLLVFNNTRVMKARLTGQKASGGKVEVLVERITADRRALAHVRSSKSPRPGTTLLLSDGQLSVRVEGRDGELFVLEFDGPVADILERHGDTPLPPYITRLADAGDDRRYQTVYARQSGAVAAPTAGLHFDQAMMERLAKAGFMPAFITLHVGAGTFQPVRSAHIREHVMHAEHYEIGVEVLERIALTRRRGGRIVAIGTTSARALEAAATLLGGVPALPPGRKVLEGETRIFITPGHEFQWVDALLTNFHLPQSTLLMMVSALAGLEPIRRAYTHAVAARYRFFSYGDAMFIEAPRP